MCGIWIQDYELDNILKMSTRLVTLVPRILVAGLRLGFLARVTLLLAFPVAGFILLFVLSTKLSWQFFN